MEAGRPGLKRLLQVGGGPWPSLCHHGAVSLDLTVSWAVASLQSSHSHSAADKQKIRSRQEASPAKVTGAFKHTKGLQLHELPRQDHSLPPATLVILTHPAGLSGNASSRDPPWMPPLPSQLDQIPSLVPKAACVPHHSCVTSSAGMMAL